MMLPTQPNFSKGRRLRFFVSTTLVLVLLIGNVLSMIWKATPKKTETQETAVMNEGFETVEQENQRGQQRAKGVIDLWKGWFNSVPMPDQKSFNETPEQMRQRQYDEKRAKEADEKRAEGNVVPYNP